MIRFSQGLLARNQVVDSSLARLTTMRVGGPCTVVTLHDPQDWPELCAMQARILGKGANLVCADDELTQPVLRLGPPFAQVEMLPEEERVRVRVGAGHDLAKLIGICTRAGLAGPEALAGVPASLGGAAFMNAGTAQAWLDSMLDRVQVLMPGESEPQWLHRHEIQPSYRHGGLPDGSLVLACELLLERGDPVQLKVRASELKQRKAATQPLSAHSAGCVFTNPSVSISAGRLLDELGCKGWRQGAALVSPIHANFIVNEGGASADDVFSLIRRCRLAVWRERGIVLRVEVQTWQAPPELQQHPQEDLTCSWM